MHLRDLLPAILMACASLAGADDGVKLLTGFEAEQVKAWGLKPAEGGLAIGKLAVITPCETTEGKQALVRTLTAKNVDWGGLKKGESEDWVRYFHGQILNATGHFPGGRGTAWFPSDFSGFGLFRMDVRSSASAMRIRVMLEDEIATPFTERWFRVPAGRWVTLQMDLAAASALREMKLTPQQAEQYGTPVAKIRTLNPARMANLMIVVEQCDKATEITLDNLRLVRDAEAEKAAFDLVTDRRPFPMPAALPDQTPRPRKSPAPPVKALAAKQEPSRIDLSRIRKPSYGRLNEQVRHAITAVDADRMVLAMSAFWPWKTLDGGATWTAMKKSLRHSSNAPGVGTAAWGADLLSIYVARCAGGGQPAVIYFRQLLWNGKDWAPTVPALVDVNSRHCPEFRVEVGRLASGRIWAAWFQDTRLRQIILKARYSDDEGRTWRDPDSNALAMYPRPTHWKRPLPLPVTVWWETPKLDVPLDRANGRIGDVHPHTNLALVPYGEHVAVVWGGRFKRRDAQLWSRFDGTRWTEPELVVRIYGGVSSATTVGDKAIHVALKGKVYRLAGEDWLEDSPPIGGADRLIAAGDTVLCIGKTVEKADAQQTTTLWLSRKPAGGKWSAPETLAVEKTESTRFGRIDVIAPQFAAGGFAPIAWGPHHGWVKVLRLLPAPLGN